MDGGLFRCVAFCGKGGLGSEYSEVHKVHMIHTVSARVNHVNLVRLGCRTTDESRLSFIARVGEI
jgi:hypothetical protein